MIAAAFAGLWLIPGVTRAVLPFVLLLPEPKGLSLEELTEPGSGQPARLLHPVRPS